MLGVAPQSAIKVASHRWAEKPGVAPSASSQTACLVRKRIGELLIPIPTGVRD
jgi:hypothetical protein